MTTEIQNAFLLAAAFIALFAIAEVLYHGFKIRVEYTRKLVHIGTGILALTFPMLLNSHWYVLALCASFAIILLFSLQFKKLPSINAIDRQSVGSLAYPLSVYLCFLCYKYFDNQYIFYYLPIIILAISDPLAAIIGKKLQWGKYAIGKESKTLIGSLTFFLSAFILVVIFSIKTPFFAHTYQGILTAFIIAIISSFTETVSKKGWDNLSIPLSVIAGLIGSIYIFGL